MGLYIPDMQMPAHGEMVYIMEGGYVRKAYHGIREPLHESKAISVPPHGRLIDTEAKVKTQLYDDEHEEWSDEVELTVEQYLGYCFNEVPTIIPAEEGET